MTKYDYLKNIKVGVVALSTLFLLNCCGSNQKETTEENSVMIVEQSDVNLNLNIEENNPEAVAVINENSYMLIVKLTSYEKYSSYDVAPAADLISKDLLWVLHTTDGEVIIKSVFDVTIFEGKDALDMAMRYVNSINLSSKSRILSLN